MNQRFKEMLQRVVNASARPLVNKLSADVWECQKEVKALRTEVGHVATKETQVALYLKYREMVSQKHYPLPSFTEVGFRCHSQFDEDGILLFLFAVIGTTNRVAVEICAGNGIECNTANLIINHGWWGHLFDGDEKNVAVGNRFFTSLPETWLFPPTFSHSWITAENVNDVIGASGASGEIDLLSLDIDGMDYWVWQAIECIQPRVVVCETHGIIPAELALTVPYDPNFRATIPDYHSASLAAMTSLAARKGYRLVGTHRYGFNAFFVRRGLAEHVLPAVTPAQCVDNPYLADARAKRWPKVKDMKWVEV